MANGGMAEAAVREQAALERAIEEFNAKCNAVEAAGSKAFGDKWGKAKQDLALLDDDGRIPMDILEIALETEDPARVLFELGRDLEKADELRGLAPIKRAIAMDKLAAPKSPVLARPRSHAPAGPVTARAATDALPRDSDSDEEWNRKEEARERRLLEARRKQIGW
ncbi:hypothetical protein [Bradyrhizobium sp. STM 3562]|uniref:hypothetical protein n=1 Tax=Bradyrhizobium sp. STM 3562 TaxID=578924 RepID=UPI00388EA13E